MSLRHRIESLSSAAFVAGAALLVGVPLVAVLPADGVVELVLGAAAAVGAAGSGAAAVLRRQAANLPLELAPWGLVGMVDGVPAYRFRAQLGRGRTMRRARATVRFEGPGGEVPLEPVLPEAPVLLGPWTIVIVDRARCCGGEGAFVVRVEAEERGRTWTAEARFPRGALRDGRFAPGFRVAGGRLRLAPEDFAQVERGGAATSA